MRKLIYILSISIILQGCLNIQGDNPYSRSLTDLTISVDYPSDFPPESKSEVKISITELNLGSTYKIPSSSDGTAKAKLPYGTYSLLLSYQIDQTLYNASCSSILLDKPAADAQLTVTSSKTGAIVFKEIYCGGCTRYPEQGNYAYDSYIVLHNNSARTEYLDSLCFAVLDPYRSGASNVWKDIDFLPVIQAIWQIKGNGSDFPLAPGEDAVIVVYGAIDHASKYTQSVNLNKADYFVCYNNTYFTNTSYHPAPGNNILKERILDVVIKTGTSNAFVLAQQSPAPVIFKAPQGTSIQEFVQNPDNIIQKPGSNVDKIVKLPYSWVIDGVEVFEPNANNKKRFPQDIDAGAVYFSGPYKGHTLMRKTDESASTSSGYQVLQDTNNSSEDFTENDTQSLHE